MQFSMQGITIITHLKETISQIKSDAGVKQFIMPSIDIFFTSISAAAREKIRVSLIASGIESNEYSVMVELYKQMQIQYLFECIDSITTCLQTLVDNKSKTDIYLNKLIDFVEYEQLLTIAPDIPTNTFEKMNSAVKFRLNYYLTDQVYTTLCQFKGGHNIISSQTYDQSILKKIDKITHDSVQNQDKRSHINLLFYSELNIREASIMALGELLRNDQLSDIFVVYKSTAFGLTDLRQQNGSISYYNLAVKTLSQLSKASSLMQPHHLGQQLSVVIQPMNQETAVGHHGLVRRSVFGVNISYQDNQGLILDVNASPGFNHVYQLEPHYKLDSLLKMAYLSHIKLLTVQLNDAPAHSHKRRRQEKLSALEHIVNADNQGELSPATFDVAKMGKPYLFVAWGESKTQQLIECGENDLKLKMWILYSKEKHSIGRLGYSMNNEDLVEKLHEKYKIYTKGEPYDPNKNILDLLNAHQERKDLSGYELWRYDKKLALEIILVAHSQQLLHPALIKEVERKFPMLCARSFWIFRESEVEALMLEVKENLTSLLWNDAANDNIYFPAQNIGIN
jgi:hypothetical protein